MRKKDHQNKMGTNNEVNKILLLLVFAKAQEQKKKKKVHLMLKTPYSNHFDQKIQPKTSR